MQILSFNYQIQCLILDFCLKIQFEKNEVCKWSSFGESTFTTPSYYHYTTQNTLCFNIICVNQNYNLLVVMVVVLPWKLVVKFVHEWILLNRFRVSLLTTQATTTYYLALYNYFISWIFFYDICQMFGLKSRAY